MSSYSILNNLFNIAMMFDFGAIRRCTFTLNSFDWPDDRPLDDIVNILNIIIVTLEVVL